MSDLATIFDTETTGLIQNRSIPLAMQPEVIEFYGAHVSLKTGKVKDKLSMLIRPARPLSPVPEGKGKKTITQITGITNEMLKGKKPFANHADEIFKFLEATPLVIAQNASFDVEMIDIEAERLGRRVKWPRVLCTVEQSIHYKGYRLNMAALYLHLTGETFDGAHRAEADTSALIRCCVEMRKRGDI